jgi:hypothetical protein
VTPCGFPRSITRTPISWDEQFAERYQEWSARMTADIGFYVELARQADRPLVELAIGNGRVAIPVAQAGRPFRLERLCVRPHHRGAA